MDKGTPLYSSLNQIASSKTPLLANTGVQIPTLWLSDITNRLIIIYGKLDKTGHLEIAYNI